MDNVLKRTTKNPSLMNGYRDASADKRIKTVVFEVRGLTKIYAMGEVEVQARLKRERP